MNERVFKQFIALAEELHFGRASSRCHASISALSRNIRHLEEELGSTLFYRDNRSVALTQDGQVFLNYARDALYQWQQVRRVLANKADTLHGEISVYCSVTATYSILKDLLNHFRPSYPNIEIKLHTGDPEHAIQRVMDGHEDLSIAAHPKTLPRGAAFQSITLSKLLFIAPLEGSILDKQHPPTPEQWASTPLILAESGLARTRVDSWFRDIGIQPLIYAQVAGNEAIVSMVSLGFGVGVVPEIVLKNNHLADKVQTLDVQPALEPFNVGLVTLKKNLKNPLIATFWSLATPLQNQ